MKMKNEDFSIEKFYNLIINTQDHRKTFLENLELWKEFYNERLLIIKNNILDERLFTIIEFLLKNEKGEIFDYFHSNLIESVEFEQGNLAFNIRNINQRSEEDIGKLLDNLTFHDNLCKVIDGLNIEDEFGSFKKYQSKNLELDTVDSLIMTLHSQFFKLPETLVKKTLQYISNNSVLLQKYDMKKNLMNTDLIFQYFDKIIPIKEFLNEEIENDPLIFQILNLEIKDKKVLNKMFKIMSSNYILKIFDDDLENFVAFAEKLEYLDETEKQILFNFVIDKIKKDHIEYLYPIITKELSSKFWNRYLTRDTYNEILTNLKSDVPVALSDEEIKFLLSNDHATNNFRTNMLSFLKRDKLLQKKNFNIAELQEKLKENIANNWDFFWEITEEKKEFQASDSLNLKYRRSVICDVTGTEIPFNIAIELFKGYLTNQINLNQSSTKAVLKSIATYMISQMGIENNGIYFFDNVENNKDNTITNGYFWAEFEIIAINTKGIEKFLDKKYSLYDQLQVFKTLFHEIKHAKIHQNKKDNIWDIETYEIEKETVMEKYDCEFYPTNYLKIKEEIEARISGNEILFKFIESFLPELLNQIQDQIMKNLEEEKELKEKQNAVTKEMDFLTNMTVKFQDGFDTLMKYNPKILKEHPIFRLEYHQNGTIKSIDEILLGRTEQNQELIIEIIKKRYPETYEKELKSTYRK